VVALKAAVLAEPAYVWRRRCRAGLEWAGRAVCRLSEAHLAAARTADLVPGRLVWG